jgi:hypothetical protein
MKFEVNISDVGKLFNEIHTLFLPSASMGKVPHDVVVVPFGSRMFRAWWGTALRIWDKVYFKSFLFITIMLN